MVEMRAFAELSPTTFGDVLNRENIMDFGIRPLWSGMPRVAGRAYTVRCEAGDNLMLHAAIYRAEPHSIIVVQAGDTDFAVAGGNVCAVAQQRGIAAFIIDGVIRDVAEIRANAFPVFARGLSPIPDSKAKIGALNEPIRCGGIHVAPQDIIVADEEGIVVIPAERAETLLKAAQLRAAKDARQTLAQWEEAHHANIEAILRERGFQG